MGGAQLANKQSRIKSTPTAKTQDVHSHVFDAELNHTALIEDDEEKPFLLILKSNN